VTAAAEAAGVALDATSPYALSDGPGAEGMPHILRAYTLKVDGRGAFDRILLFLRRIEQGNPLLCVFNLTIEAVADDPERHRMRLDVQWPVWSNEAVVEKILAVDGIAELPAFRASEPPPLEPAHGLGDPFRPLDYSPERKETTALETQRRGETDEQWREAELLLKVTGHGFRSDGEPYAIVNGAVKGKGDRVSVRAGGYEYAWRVGAVSRGTGIRFERLDVRTVDGAPAP
jgi:hypothetical protein